MKLLIIANWKMNPQTLKEAKRLFKAVALKSKMQPIRQAQGWPEHVEGQKVKGKQGVEVVICPPFVYLPTLNPKPYPSTSSRSRAKSRDTLNFKLGAQDVFWQQKGAYTGEISSKMLKDLGCKYAIIGHSERRKYLKETDAVINKKLLAAAEANLRIIFCVGEKSGENITSVLRKQLQRGLKKFPQNKTHLLNIAYEPVWAIGTGKPCLPENALIAKALIRKILAGIFKKTVAKKIRILYGGSVNSKISASYIKEAGMDGLLVGGTSLKPKEFVSIVESVKSSGSD